MISAYPNRWLFYVLFIWLAISVRMNSFAQDSSYLHRLPHLRSAIQKVLTQTNIPGLGIAIVTREGPLWIDGLGKSNIAENLDADEHTMFRVASVTKMFAGLAILKLQEEGRINLHDKVRALVPDVAFDNPWEEAHPVRVVHLLEHTTGWDDYHLVEQTDVPLTLKEGLDFHPHSRTSRWIPGSRMAYNNSGAAVAAYIVERVTGKLYEDYVAENFFQPLNMTHSTFFDDEKFKRYGTTLYNQSLEPLGYRHVIQRPAGGLHTSPDDMGRFLQFLLNRGRVGSLQWISEESLVRMESTLSTPGASAGLELGFGLGNYTSLHNGFTYHGHNGAMPGALAELAYLPDHGIGHAFFINSFNGPAFSQISTMIRDFETEALKYHGPANRVPSVPDFKFISGYYFPINPRLQWGYFLDRIFDIQQFEKRDSVVIQSWIGPGKNTVFVPVSDSTFSTGSSGIIGLVKAIDPLEGEVLFTDSKVFKRIPAWLVFGQFSIVVLWIVMMFFGTIVWVFALSSYRRGKNNDALKIASFPMMATLMLWILCPALLFVPRYNNELLISPSWLSMGLLAVSVWFVLSAIYALVRLYEYRPATTGRMTYWSMALLSCLHFVVAVYLMWFGVIPVVTWF